MAGRLKDLISRIWNWRLKRHGQQQDCDVRAVPEEENIVRALGHFEPYVLKVQSILVWENPVMSVSAIVLVNLLFALAVSFEIRFYGLIFSTLLLAFILDFWMEKIWPRITVAPTTVGFGDGGSSEQSRLLSVSDICRYLAQMREVLKNYYTWLKNLRDDQPGTFCCAMCFIFAVLTFIGRTVPGAVMGYCGLMLVMTGPGICIHLLPAAFKQRVSSFQAALRHREKGLFVAVSEQCLNAINCVLAGDDSEVDEYLPEQSCETLALLQQVADPVDEDQKEESLIVEEFGLDLASVDVTGHDEGSTDGLDMSEFELSTPPSLGGSTTNSQNNYQTHPPPVLLTRRKHDLTIDDSDDSDLDVNDGIHFQSHHFNQDSSEEEEQAFVQGLAFPEPSVVPAAPAPAQPPPSTLGEMFASSAVSAVSQNIANLGALGSCLLSSVISGAVEKVAAPPEQTVAKPPRDLNRDDSSSSGGESEFEMISHQDLS